jgi:SAM-dependent methyltransferase
MHLTYRKTCRACGSSALEKVIDLGEQYIQGAFVKPGIESPALRKMPMALVRCDPMRDEHACGLLQASCTVPPEILYSVYWYRSGTNETMTTHLRGITDEATRISDGRSARVLDIGCNDGTLLRQYPDAFLKFGIDPSDAIASVGSDVVAIQDLFPSPELRMKMGGNLFDIVTSIAMFYDLEDPIAFVKSVREVLAPDGVWVFEMSYMPSMLRMNSYDTICHEHLEYYSLAVLEFILDRADMRIFRGTLNDSNGGSIRAFASHKASVRYRRKDLAGELESLRRQEFDLELDTGKPYRNFQRNVDRHKDALSQMLRELRRAGKTIHVYGASTKGNTILQLCGLDHSVIDYAADRNPDKFGARTIGTDIPIISEDESGSMRPDYYLVLPWHFKAEFLRRERETIANGTSMIFPLPEITVVDRTSLVPSAT